jgi:hypothetical protein
MSDQPQFQNQSSRVVSFPRLAGSEPNCKWFSDKAFSTSQIHNRKSKSDIRRPDRNDDASPRLIS